MDDVGVIFDMDGLMLDTESVSRESWNRAIGECDLPEMSHELFISMVGCRHPSIIAILTPHYGERTLEVIKRAEAHYHALLCETPPAIMKGLLPLLDWLEEQHIPKVVATSSGPHGAKKKLTDSGLIGRFSHIVTGDQVENGKPAPDIFLHAASLIPRDPKNCFVLEDSKHGILGAHRAGAHAIMVPDLVAPDEEIQQLAFAICEDLSCAQGVLAKSISS